MEYENALSIDEMVRRARLRELLASGEAQRLRQSAGVSRLEMARHCRVTTSTVTRWESGEKQATTRRALGYLDLLERLNEIDTSGPGWPD